jgi:hypothetical protein
MHRVSELPVRLEVTLQVCYTCLRMLEQGALISLSDIEGSLVVSLCRHASMITRVFAVLGEHVMCIHVLRRVSGINENEATYW